MPSPHTPDVVPKTSSVVSLPHEKRCPKRRQHRAKCNDASLLRRVHKSETRARQNRPDDAFPLRKPIPKRDRPKRKTNQQHFLNIVSALKNHRRGNRRQPRRADASPPT